MPIPRPRDGENQDDFVGRCHEALVDEYDDTDQRHAVCMDAWRSRNNQRVFAIFASDQAIEVRREQLDGREHLVFPLVALVEGVFKGANSPRPSFHAVREFGKNPDAWNGRPVTIGHPKRGGSLVSAASPDVWCNERIGTTFNAFVDADKLRIEAWIDPEAVDRAGDLAKTVVAAAEAGDQVEVSVGTWVDEVPRVGSHRGRKYEVADTNYQADHVALLEPGMIGACSWEDGCGVRVAMATDQPEPCCEACANGRACNAPPQVDQTARSRETALKIAIEEEFGRWSTVVDHDDQHVYFGADELPGLRRLGYREDDDGNITLDEGDSERVRPRTDFVVVANQQEDGDMADKDVKPAATETSPPKKAQEPTAHGADVLKALAEAQAEIEHLRARLDKPKPKTLEEYFADAPPEIRDLMVRAHKAETAKRLQMVQQVMTAPGCMYGEDQLKAMSIDDLEKLLALTHRGIDYSVQPAEASTAPLDLADGERVPVKPASWLFEQRRN